MKLNQITEARKNPSQNKKISGIDVIRGVIDRYGPYTDKFVSFTNIEKLGIYPGSPHNTPVGIYAYPLSYIANEISPSHKKMDSVVPYAGDFKNFYIFNATGTIVDLADTDQCRHYIAEFIQDSGMSRGDFIKELKNRNLTCSTPGFLFWSASLFLAMQRVDKDEHDADGTTDPSVDLKNRTQIAWTAIFRKFGIDGVVDSEGFGIIHENEPTQAVFFSRGTLENVQSYVNHNSARKITKKVAQIDTEFKKLISLHTFNVHRHQIIDIACEKMERMQADDVTPFNLQKYVRELLPFNFISDELIGCFNSKEVKMLFPTGELQRFVPLNESDEIWNTFYKNLADSFDIFKQQNINSNDKFTKMDKEQGSIILLKHLLQIQRIKVISLISSAIKELVLNVLKIFKIGDTQ